jgi:hypothetical protein
MHSSRGPWLGTQAPPKEMAAALQTAEAGRAEAAPHLVAAVASVALEASRSFVLAAPPTRTQVRPPLADPPFGAMGLLGVTFLF